jgi:hypothetical protein
MFPALSTFGKHGQETMSPGLSTFGKHGQETMSPGLSTFRKQCLHLTLFFSENCQDKDQSYTLSYSINDVKRRKRSHSTEDDGSELENLYSKIDELQTHVLSQQETLRNIVNKVKK